MTTRSSQRFGRRATAALVLGFLQIISLSAQDDAQKKELIARYGTPGEHSPEVTHVSLVAPNVIELTIEAQKVVPTTLVAYVAQPGDRKKIQKWPDGTVRRAIVVRDGTEIGWLQGKKLDQFSAFEGIEGDPLLHFLGENPANFKIASKDDPAFQPPQQPEAVFRKSVPIDWQMPMNVFPMRHRIYLQLKGKLTPGKSYQIAVSNLNVRNPELSFVNNPNKVRSDAVHVNQLGYRPDDPGKRAFLSTWLGTGGALIYPEGLRFSVVNDATGKSMLSGTVKLVLAPEQTETLAGKDTPNHSKTAIYSMDFDALSTPGRYRVVVEGVGCSYPFEINADVWKKAFCVQMRGLFHNRSGVELGPPYTTFKKPRDFHPADGAVVTRTTYDPLTRGDDFSRHREREHQRSGSRRLGRIP
jgi:endoglucanase